MDFFRTDRTLIKSHTMQVNDDTVISSLKCWLRFFSLCFSIQKASSMSEPLEQSPGVVLILVQWHHRLPCGSLSATLNEAVPYAQQDHSSILNRF